MAAPREREGPLHPTHEPGKEATFLLKAEAVAGDFTVLTALLSKVRTEASEATERFALTHPLLLFPTSARLSSPWGNL